MQNIHETANQVVDFIKSLGIDVSVQHSTNRNEQKSYYVSCKIGEIRISDHIKSCGTSSFSFVNTPAHEIIEVLQPIVQSRIAKDNERNALIKSASSKLTGNWKRDRDNITRPKTEDARAVRKQNFMDKFGLTLDEFQVIGFVR